MSLNFLHQELSDEIEDYTHRFNTEDQVEWNLVLQEVAAFIEVRIAVSLSCQLLTVFFCWRFDCFKVYFVGVLAFYTGNT